jgi:hypothetical protein
VEVVYAILAFDGVAATVVGRRLEPTLDISAKSDVFLLNFIAKSHGAFDTFANLFGMRAVEEPLEDGEGFIVR